MFQYWFPGLRSKPSSEQVAEAGLTYALTRYTHRGSDNGPDGQRGVTVVEGGNEDGRLGYWPAKQTWRQLPGNDVWVGMYTDDALDPQRLARAEQITGQWITADDGSRWLAPMAKRWHEINGDALWSCNLPQRLVLNDAGLWLPGGPTPRYTRLWDLATQYEQRIFEVANGQTAKFDEDQVAILALQVNYRIGPAELDLLGIYNMEFRRCILQALLDVDTFVSWFKKKQMASTSADPVDDGGSF